MAKDGDEVKQVGCGGLLLIPLSTVVVGFRLLLMPGRATGQNLGPYRAPARVSDHAPPLTPRSARMVGALFLFWTLLLPALFAARAIMITWTTPMALVMVAGATWVAMFVGHLISVKLFVVVEPHLPHDEA